MTMASYGIHWFRRDLRVAGNPGLRWSWKEHQGRVLGIFCFDSKFLGREDFSPNRFAFFLDTLKELRSELRELGGDLLVLDQSPKNAFTLLLKVLNENKVLAPATLSFNRDYEPFARVRDEEMETLFSKDWGILTKTFRDHLIIEPWEIYKEEHQKSFYQVYSPFAKKWFAQFHSEEIKKRITSQDESLKYLRSRMRGPNHKTLFSLNWKNIFGGKSVLVDKLEEYIRKNEAAVTISIPPGGSVIAFERLQAFKKSIDHYGDSRDIPSLDGTSQMSLYLKNGSLTTAQVIAALDLHNLSFRSESSHSRYLKELVWREFYYSILYHAPRVEKEAFLPKYKNLKWKNDPKLFKAWCDGMTGYPIIDAGMRQLNTTGWMHNRVRMIVASFLCKDLLINWQWGEKYFMRMLLDGDLAPNNGGWQWAASTGCDPQPYFRIFNPLLQSQKFDPEGDYIRKFVPELRHLSSKEIHQPHLAGVKIDYPLPIVDHFEQKEKALTLYKI